MSSSIYSTIVVGVPATVLVNSCEKVYKRFHPQTGVALDLKAEAQDIQLVIGDVTFTLPDDPKVAREEIGRYDTIPEWFNSRRDDRIREFLEEREVSSDTEESESGTVCYLWLSDDRILIGEVLLSGYPFDWYGDDLSCREIPFEKIPKSIAMVQDHLLRHFKTRVIAKPYLVRELGG